MSSPFLASSDTSAIFRPLLCSPSAKQMDTKSGRACHFILMMNLSNSCRLRKYNVRSRIFLTNLYLDTQQCKTLLTDWIDVNCFKTTGVPSSERVQTGFLLFPGTMRNNMMTLQTGLTTRDKTMGEEIKSCKSLRLDINN